MLTLEKTVSFENNCFVSSVDTNNFNKSYNDRVLAVTDLAAITKGELKIHNPEEVDDRKIKLYNKLSKESNGDKSTPFEFIPVFIKSIYDDITDMQKSTNYLYEIDNTSPFVLYT